MKPYQIIITDTHIQVGCFSTPIKRWKSVAEKMRHEDDVPIKLVDKYAAVIDALLKFR